MKCLVIHTETGVICGSFNTQEAAQGWIAQLGVVAEYKERCYKIVDAASYWENWRRSHR